MIRQSVCKDQSCKKRGAKEYRAIDYSQPKPQGGWKVETKRVCLSCGAVSWPDRKAAKPEKAPAKPRKTKTAKNELVAV